MTRSAPIRARSPRKALTACALRTCGAPTSPANRPTAPASEPQTIALVDAYNDPNAEADLKVYDQEFGLPNYPMHHRRESNCFEKVNQSGKPQPPFPTRKRQDRRNAVCKKGQVKKRSSLQQVRSRGMGA